MPEMFHAELIGGKELIAGLQAMREELPSRTVPNGLKAAASYMAAQVQLAAPVGSDKHSGQLEGAIFVTSANGRRYAQAGVAVRNPAFYWRFLELGWTSRGGNRFQYPFAGPIVKESFATAAQIVIDAVKSAMDKYGNRLYSNFIRSV